MVKQDTNTLEAIIIKNINSITVGRMKIHCDRIVITNPREQTDGRGCIMGFRHHQGERLASCTLIYTSEEKPELQYLSDHKVALSLANEVFYIESISDPIVSESKQFSEYKDMLKYLNAYTCEYTWG
jgi:hypothetical protein